VFVREQWIAKANTWFWLCIIRCRTSLYEFNDLHAEAGLARQMPLLMVESTAQLAGISKF
jgi:hypothetical protein